jgi:hypothetical protein
MVCVAFGRVRIQKISLLRSFSCSGIRFYWMTQARCFVANLACKAIGELLGRHSCGKELAQ